MLKVVSFLLILGFQYVKEKILCVTEETVLSIPYQTVSERLHDLWLEEKLRAWQYRRMCSQVLVVLSVNFSCTWTALKRMFGGLYIGVYTNHAYVIFFQPEKNIYLNS
jgi:hypothetical protein